MTELLRRVLDEPEATAPRLVYADWLAEQGDRARADFIATQCRLAETDPRDDAWPGLEARSRRLLARHGVGWLSPQFDLDLSRDVHTRGRYEVDWLRNARFERGFLAHIALDADELDRVWPALRAVEPVDGLQLLGVDEAIPPSCEALPLAADLRELRVNPTGWFHVHSLAVALRWPLGRLRSLDLRGCELGLDGARLLVGDATDLGDHFDDYVAPPALPAGQLTRLGLRDTMPGDEGVALLLRSPVVSGLEALDLCGCGLVGATPLQALRDAAMPQLRELDLTRNTPLGAALEVLVGWATLSRLEVLGLPLSTTPGSLAALFPEPSHALRELRLPSAKGLLEDPAAVARCATALTGLDIGTTRVGDKALAALLGDATATVRQLRVSGCSLSDKGLATLLERGPQRLVALDLSSNKLTDDALAMLAGWPGMRHVCELRLGNNRKLTAAGFQALVDADHLDLALLDIGRVEPSPELVARFGDALA